MGGKIDVEIASIPRHLANRGDRITLQSRVTGVLANRTAVLSTAHGEFLLRLPHNSSLRLDEEITLHLIPLEGVGQITRAGKEPEQAGEEEAPLETLEELRIQPRSFYRNLLRDSEATAIPASDGNPSAERTVRRLSALLRILSRNHPELGTTLTSLIPRVGENFNEKFALFVMKLSQDVDNILDSVGSSMIRDELAGVFAPSVREVLGHGPWVVSPIPYFHAGKLHRLLLATEVEREYKWLKRFVVDLYSERFGRVQVHCHHSRHSSRFDLLFGSPLDEAVERDIEALQGLLREANCEVRVLVSPDRMFNLAGASKLSLEI